MGLDSVDLGRDSAELADGEMDLDCGEAGAGSSGVVDSNLDSLGGSAVSSIFLMLSRIAGTSRHSASKTKNQL